MEQKGALVADLSLQTRNTRWLSRALLLFPALCYALTAAVGVIFDTTSLWLCACCASAVVGYGVFDEQILRRRQMRIASGTLGATKSWLAVSLAVKFVATFVALGIIAAGVRNLNTKQSAIGFALIPLGLVCLSLAHKIPEILERRLRSTIIINFAETAGQFSILLVRSFKDDRAKIRAPWSLSGPSRPLFSLGKIRFEEFIAMAFTGFGELVAIGRPGENYPLLGAGRTYYPDDSWQKAIRMTAAASGAVVVIAGTTTALNWELELLRSHGMLHKTLVLFPPFSAEQSYERVRRVCEILDLDSKIISTDYRLLIGLTFSANSTPIYYLSMGRDYSAYVLAVTHFEGMLNGRIEPPEPYSVQRSFDRISKIDDWLDP